MEIELNYQDGSKRKIAKGSLLSEIAPKDAVVAKLDGKLVDLSTPVDNGTEVEFFSARTPEGLEVMRHSCAHVLADAVLRLFPEALPTIGPVIENGFYYDFDFGRAFTPEDLKKLETEMNRIIAKREPFERKGLSKSEALKLFKGNKYKLELIEEFGENLTAYRSGSFLDLCRGPHVPHVGHIKSFKLTKAAGAYWRGEAKNPQLQRIYGIAFVGEQELKDHLRFLEEAEKRDHRKLTRELDLVYFHEYAPGAPFFLKKGTIIYNLLTEFIREEYKKRGYEEVITPQLYNKKLWEISGHWDHYRENMFIVNIEGQEHSLKPMNCPSHCLIYNRAAKSYRDLPVRIADFCNLHRNELSGVLSGLFRVRKFAQDDGHIFCRFDQIEEEVLGVLDFIQYVWTKVFNFNLEYYLSTRPEKALGTKEIWDQAEGLLSSALTKAGIPFNIRPGEGAFYGPKIDIDIEDALGRKWQCPTCQLDFNLPKRFETEYMDEASQKQTAVMIHRAVLGSLERFFGILTEHYAGKFPLWLNPEQVRVLTVADRFNPYAEEVIKRYDLAGIRVSQDFRAESVSKKVRDAQMGQVNYMMVIGEQEVGTNTVNIRTRDNKVLGQRQPEEFLKELLEEIKLKK
jgi:threonyl-tRNA synthetase